MPQVSYILITISRFKHFILNCISLCSEVPPLTEIQGYSAFNVIKMCYENEIMVSISTATLFWQWCINLDLWPLQVLSFSNSHVITCDRDEKIRVSRYPNAYNIETFCLGHTEWVVCTLWLCIRIEPKDIIRHFWWVFLGVLPSCT